MLNERKLSSQCNHSQELHKSNSTFLDDDDCDDHTVDTEDTSHDNRNNRFHDELWFENTHGADANTGLSTAVGCTKVGEDECGGDSAVYNEDV